MAEVAEMGEIDEVHSNEEGVILNGDTTKDMHIDHSDVDMDDKIPNADALNTNKDSEKSIMEIQDMNDVEMENREEVSSQSAMDDDSQDSQGSQTSSQVSQDGNSQSSQDSQDSNMESEHNNLEENASSQSDVNDDSNTNGSLLPTAMANETGSPRNEECGETSSSTSEDTRETKLAESQVHSTESSQVGNSESDLKSQNNDRDSGEHDDMDSSSKSDSSSEDDGAENETRKPNEESDPKDSKKTTDEKAHDTIELNSEDEGDVLIIDTPKSNGTEVINLVDSPDKKQATPVKSKDEKSKSELIAPRRSSRNVNRNKSYVENTESPPRREQQQQRKDDESEESDIEEVLPQDPLAVNDQITVERIPSVKKTMPDNTSSGAIVVKDTKRLVEIATKSNQNSSNQLGKKEPTLVIIDTNSILSGIGRGSIPVSSSTKTTTQPMATSNFANMLPMAVPAQGMYPANMRATITPIPVSNSPKMSSMMSSPALQQQTSSAPLLPTLTDDMFVVEAPSFIVPYVYEKPPVKLLKEFVIDMKKDIKEKRKQEKATEDKKSDNGKGDSDASNSSDEGSEDEKMETDPKKPYSYFDSPLGKFFIDIGVNMVQEYVQSDLLKQQKRKRDREQGSNPETNKTIASLMKNIEMSKGNNQHFKMEVKKCEFCNFKTESKLAMSYHLETPHMKNFVYKCNFCPYEVRSPHDILFHMEAEHAVRGHLERAPAFHQCPSCPFEDNQKGKLSRHLVVCARKFKPERNLEPPPDWEPPAKIPRMPKMRATGLTATVAAYQTLAGNKTAQQYQFLSKMQLQANAAAATTALNRGRGRPTLGPNVKAQPIIRPQGMIFKQQGGSPVLVPTSYPLGGNQVFQTSQSSQQSSKKPSNTPSISITPLPRATTTAPSSSKPGDTNSKNAFVICEICDGYIKDLEALRNHMQWIHKIKIHPKMIYNRPPLNCQKCQFRFFTDQGLERHLLGSHGLVTSSMQEAANKSKDSGRCPVCGRVYQWKLLNHVAKDHAMTLKPAHLSYKCTVCTATFGMYKQFENHVYSAHSVVAKRVMDKKSTSSAGSPSASKTTDLKPLKINDEITIIPQPAKSSSNGPKENSPAPKNSAGTSKAR